MQLNARTPACSSGSLRGPTFADLVFPLTQSRRRIVEPAAVWG